ncbi:MAG TPA: TlpA disulfide reductase family protein [Gemmatimonadales bacterium]
MTNKAQWIAVGVILATLTFALLAAVALSPEMRRVDPGSEAPEFLAIDIASGDTVNFADLKGEVVLLNIWATWCAPCEAEMPSLQRLHEEMAAEGLRIVAVSVDVGDTPKVVDWINERRLTFTVLHDRTGRIEQVYQATGVPETFVIDRRGVIVKKLIGPTEWDHPTQKALFRRLLAGE